MKINMTSLQGEQINPPKDWQQFQRMCRDLWKNISNDPLTQCYASLGQRQNGVDIFGRIDRGDNWFGVQCKNKNNLEPENHLKVSEIKQEVEKAKQYSPTLKEYIIAYTGPTRRELQDEANRLTEENKSKGVFSVHVCSWEELEGYLAQNTEVYIEYYGDVRFVNSLIAFSPLSILSERTREFLNYKQLFEGDLIFFLEEEKYLIEEIKSILIGKTERLVLMEGQPAKGKTVIAYVIGRQLEKIGYQIFYIRFNTSVRFDEVWKEINYNYAKNTLFILDDCHLNIDIASRIYTQYSELYSRKNISCLLISTTTDVDIRASSSLDVDYIKELENRNQYYSLDDITQNKFGDKILGITRKRKSFIEANKKIQLTIGDEQELISNTGENLIILNARFEFWDQAEPLSKQKSSDIHIKMYTKYLEPLRTEERDTLLQIASLSKYETRFQIPQDKEEVCKVLRNKGLCNREISGLLIGPRASFSSLLIDAFANNINFKSSFKSMEDFLFENYRNYIDSFPLYPRNLEEVLQNLLNNKVRGLLDLLLHNKEVKKRILDFYASECSIEGLISFLFKAKHYLSSEDVQNLTIDNNELKGRVIESQKSLLNFVKLLKTIRVCDEQSYPKLMKQFITKDYELMIQKSNFYVFCYSVHSMKEKDHEFAWLLLSQVSANDLIIKIKDCSLGEVLGGLKHLQRVNAQKTETLLKSFTEIDNESFSRTLQDIRFDELAQTITDLNRINSVETRKLLSRIPNDYWISLMNQCNLTTLALGLSYLKDANPIVANNLLEMLEIQELQEKVIISRFSTIGNSIAEINKINQKISHDIIGGIDDTRLAGTINRIPLVHVGKGLSEISRVDLEKAKKILAQADKDILSHKIKTSDYKTISKSLSELFRIDKDTAKTLFREINSLSLANDIQELPLEAVGRCIAEFNYIDKTKAKEILELVDWRSLVKRFEDIPIIQIGHTLSEIFQADKDHAQSLYYYIPIETLEHKIRTEHLAFQQLGTLVQQFSKVDIDKEKTCKLINSIDVEYLVRMAKSVRFGELSAGLYDIFKLKKSIPLARAILSHFDLALLEKKASKENFEKVCSALNRLVEIDKRITESLLNSLHLSWFTERSSSLSIDRLSGCLSELANADLLLARNILNAYDKEKILKEISRLDNQRKQNVLGRLRKIDPRWKEGCIPT